MIGDTSGDHDCNCDKWSQRLVTDYTHARTHALIFAFITFCFLVTIAFKESEQLAGIMEEFWIVLKSAREASLVHNAIMFLKLLHKCCVYRSLKSSTKLNSFED